MKRPTKQRADRPLIEELEPRILYSADLAPAGLDDALTDAPEQRLLGDDGEFEADAATAAPATTSEAEFISSSLAFETNAGQFDAAVDFVARGSSQTVYLTGGNAVIDLHNADGSGHVVRLDIVGASGGAVASGQDQLATRSNYLIGAQDQWHSNVENYGSV